jgi:tight adherence protein B
MSLSALALAIALLVSPLPARHTMMVYRRSTAVPSRILVTAAVAITAVVTAAVAAPGVGLAVGLMALTFEMRRRRGSRRRRRDMEATALQGALDVLVGELRVGAHPVAAFAVAAREVDEVVASSLRIIAARARIGADVSSGMREIARRSTLPSHWESLAVCWRLAHTHGLAIGTLMKTAHSGIVERERFSARVHAGMAGARATAGVLAGLPVIGVGLGQLIGASPLQFLLRGGAGGWLLTIGVGLACAGLLWSDRIIDRVAT